MLNISGSATRWAPPAAARFGDDRAVAKMLVEKFGVAAIPPSVFYKQAPDEGRRLLRFAFCKKMETLERAAERLRRIAAVA